MRNCYRMILAIWLVSMLTSCSFSVPDDPNDTGFPFELPQYDMEDQVADKDTGEEIEADMPEATPQIEFLKLPAFTEVYEVDLTYVLDASAKAKRYTLNCLPQGKVLLSYIFYQDCILVMEYHPANHTFYEEYAKPVRVKDYFFCPHGNTYYGYVLERTQGDNDISNYKHVWTFESYDQIVQLLLNDMSGSYPSLAYYAGLDSRAEYIKTVNYHIEYSPYASNSLYADVYCLEDPQYGRMLYLANPQTHLLERVVYLDDPTKITQPYVYEGLDEKEVAVFLAEEELREISADTWQSWTDRELLFASKQVANFSYTYGPQLGSITPGDYKSQQEDWKYLLKFLVEKPKDDNES